MEGLWKNRYQFSLLVLVNAFVGAMLGLERAVLPGLGKSEFGINEYTALLSFIAVFGATKALANLGVSALSSRYSRKSILVTGWIAAIPVPLLLMYATSWNWIILANVLLGINQGLAWSSTVIMKIDLVGSRNRGLAMGINEFAGYLAVGLMAWAASGIAVKYGYAFYPFIPGLFFAAAGLLISVFLVKDTLPFVKAEAETSTLPLLDAVWKQTSWKHQNMGPVTINGIANNLNDGIMWGLLPLLLLQKGFSIVDTGLIVGIYPLVWGISQLFTGRFGDTHCKKQIITAGMLLQAVAIVSLALSSQLYLLLISSALLGLGTGLVYPNFLTVIAENTHPMQRSSTLSIFRFWRDSGYVLGALLSGVLADLLGIVPALLVVALITAGAGLLAHFRMCCTRKMLWNSPACPGLY